MRINTEGLIIKVTDTGESDRLLTILTRDFGLLRAFANGAKKLKSRSQSATQALCYARFSLFRNRDTYTIDEAQGIESFYKLRENITALSLAQYFCELGAHLAPADAQAQDYLRLLLNSLHLLAHNKKPQVLLKAVAELRLLCLSGYQPDLAACHHCSAETLDGAFVFFHLKEGVLSCAQCGEEGRDGIKIGLGILAAMRHICDAEMEKLFAFQLPAPSLLALGEICEAYAIQQMEQRFATLEFYKAIAATT